MRLPKCHPCCSNCAASALRGRGITGAPSLSQRVSSTDSLLEYSALKTVLGESCDAVAQAQSMSYLNLAWGLGTILGPVIGGYFVYPCDGVLSHDSYFCQHGSLLRTRYTASSHRISSPPPTPELAPHFELLVSRMLSCLAHMHCTGADLAARKQLLWAEQHFQAQLGTSVIMIQPAVSETSMSRQAVHSDSHELVFSSTGEA